MRIHYLQHVAFEGPAGIAEWARKNGHLLTGTHLYNYETVPSVEQFDLLVIMGGPMNIYEEDIYPWLRYEKQFIKTAIDSNKAVLGICLGAQLITEVLEGVVTRNPEKEIGWLPVTFDKSAAPIELFKDFPETTAVFQWHGDTFSTLGKDCRCIAGSPACRNQAFIYRDRVIGFQFHMESTEESIIALIDNCENEMTDGKYVQTREYILANLGFLRPVNLLMEDLLHRLEMHFI